MLKSNKKNSKSN